MIKAPWTIGVGLSVLALGACHPVQGRHHHGFMGVRTGGWEHTDDDRPVTVAASLTCPENQGRLSRISVGADGRSCRYAGDEGEEVTLSLLDLQDRSPQAALAATELALHRDVPTQTDQPVNIAAHDGPPGEGDADSHSHDRADIDLPGLHIHTDGDRARVKVLGADIDADDSTHRADIKTDWGMKGATIHASNGGAEIRAGEVGRNAANLVYVLASDKAGPQGFRAVGYVARGPATGPLVVGEFRARNQDHNHGGHDRDLDRLIDLNVRSAGG